jgi:mannose-6-phosphate isomerase
MSSKNNLFKLTGKVQHYQWGGYSFLPDLLNIPNMEGNPFAEYWLGAHDNFPAAIEGAEPELLNEYVHENSYVLGLDVARQFGRLPYLLKVLDVKDMLSIQVHPSKASAVLEFEKENKAGVPINDLKRNYKDDNHKPELMLALSDFWLLHGFKTEQGIRQTISAVNEFAFMLPLFEEGGYKKLYTFLMEMDQQKVNDILEPLIERITPLYTGNILQKNDANFWAARAALTFNQQGIIDRGIFSVYLLNLVNLKPGEAIFQGAGMLHAYLEGQNMEIMANSDNVLRGGLTPKHIDVAELIKHVSFTPTIPSVVRGTKRTEFEEVYLSPAADFQLSKLTITQDEPEEMVSTSTEIFFLFEGAAELTEADGHKIKLERGEAAVAFAGSHFTVRGKKGILFRASVPSPS